jgi:phosphoenolpyruvate synthase/pyruvate phosphate dikinase
MPCVEKARDEMGLTNIQIMIPFVRTVSEAKRVIELLAQNGLKRGENGLKIIMMCEFQPMLYWLNSSLNILMVSQLVQMT